MLSSQGSLNRLGATGRNPYGPSAASLYLDFTASNTLDSRITFTRATKAWYFNSSGVLTQADDNQARFDYNPSTLAPRGLLIEEARTNSIRNNTMQGAVAGTPGTMPTNWSAAYPGCTREIVGVGSENGINYIDLRFSGTSSASTNALIAPELTTSVAASVGQTWTSSYYVKLVAGSLTGVTLNTRISERDNTGAPLGSLNGPALTVTSSLARTSYAGTLVQATVAFVAPQVVCQIPIGNVVDFTLRIGLPQLEQGAFATSVIPTTTTALTRNADVASMTGTAFSSWYNASAGTVVAVASSANFANFPFFTQMHDGTNSNQIATMYRSLGSGRLEGVVSGVAWTSVNTANTVSAGTVNKLAFAWTASNQAVTLNAGTVATGTNANIPTVTAMHIGGSRTQGDMLNGYLQRIAYYPTRLSNAQLQALTA